MKGPPENKGVIISKEEADSEAEEAGLEDEPFSGGITRGATARKQTSCMHHCSNWDKFKMLFLAAPDLTTIKEYIQTILLIDTLVLSFIAPIIYSLDYTGHHAPADLRWFGQPLYEWRCYSGELCSLGKMVGGAKGEKHTPSADCGFTYQEDYKTRAECEAEEHTWRLVHDGVFAPDPSNGIKGWCTEPDKRDALNKRTLLGGYWCGKWEDFEHSGCWDIVSNAYGKTQYIHREHYETKEICESAKDKSGHSHEYEWRVEMLTRLYDSSRKLPSVVFSNRASECTGVFFLILILATMLYMGMILAGFQEGEEFEDIVKEWWTWAQIPIHACVMLLFYGIYKFLAANFASMRIMVPDYNLVNKLDIPGLPSGSTFHYQVRSMTIWVMVSFIVGAAYFLHTCLCFRTQAFQTQATMKMRRSQSKSDLGLGHVPGGLTDQNREPSASAEPSDGRAATNNLREEPKDTKVPDLPEESAEGSPRLLTETQDGSTEGAGEKLLSPDPTLPDLPASGDEREGDGKLSKDASI